MGTSSNILIIGAFRYTSSNDLQEILVKENITYPLNYQPKFHNIQRGADCLGGSIITTNIGNIFFLRPPRRVPVLLSYRNCNALSTCMCHIYCWETVITVQHVVVFCDLNFPVSISLYFINNVMV